MGRKDFLMGVVNQCDYLGQVTARIQPMEATDKSWAKGEAIPGATKKSNPMRCRCLTRRNKVHLGKSEEFNNLENLLPGNGIGYGPRT